MTLSARSLLHMRPGRPRATDVARGADGVSDGEKAADIVRVAKIRAQFRNCRRVLLDCGASLGLGSRINGIVYAVVVEDRKLGDLARQDIQNLRCGLNALARYLG